MMLSAWLLNWMRVYGTGSCAFSSTRVMDMVRSCYGLGHIGPNIHTRVKDEYW